MRTTDVSNDTLKFNFVLTAAFLFGRNEWPLYRSRRIPSSDKNGGALPTDRKGPKAGSRVLSEISKKLPSRMWPCFYNPEILYSCSNAPLGCRPHHSSSGVLQKCILGIISDCGFRPAVIDFNRLERGRLLDLIFQCDMFL